MMHTFLHGIKSNSRNENQYPPKVWKVSKSYEIGVKSVHTNSINSLYEYEVYMNIKFIWIYTLYEYKVYMIIKFIWI